MQQAIIVGHPQSGYEHVVRLLQSSGMALARPSRREQLSPQQITATLLKVHGVPSLERMRGEQALQQVQAAPVWSGMVLDLLLGNLDAPLWGWADPQAVHLLDYWKAQDPQTVFVLVYDAPHTALSRLSLEHAAAPPEQLQQRLDAWVAYNAALLAFYLRNPQRSVLVHAGQVRHSVRRSLQLIGARVDAPLSLPATDMDIENDADDTITTTDALPPELVDEHAGAPGLDTDAQAQLLLGLVLQSHPQAQSLYEELQAAAALPLDDNGQGNALALGATQRYRAWQSFVQLYHRAEDADELRQQIEDLQQARQQTENRYRQAEQEAGQILAQLHQTQGELERYYLQGKAQTEAAKEARARLEEQTRELKQAQAEIAEQQIELARIHAIGEEQAKASGQARDKLDKKARELEQVRERLQKLQEELDIRNQQPDPAALQQENDQLLSHLHQTQEELERYYLENKQLKSKAAKQEESKAYYGAADRVKRQLSYRLGATMIEHSRSPGGWLSMPFALRAEARRFHREKATHANEALPPIARYADAHEAERIKQHLPYRLGARMLANSRSLRGWLGMPWALRNEVRESRKNHA